MRDGATRPSLFLPDRIEERVETDDEGIDMKIAGEVLSEGDRYYRVRTAQGAIVLVEKTAASTQKSAGAKRIAAWEHPESDIYMWEFGDGGEVQITQGPDDRWVWTYREDGQDISGSWINNGVAFDSAQEAWQDLDRNNPDISTTRLSAKSAAKWAPDDSPDARPGQYISEGSDGSFASVWQEGGQWHYEWEFGDDGGDGTAGSQQDAQGQVEQQVSGAGGSLDWDGSTSGWG